MASGPVRIFGAWTDSEGEPATGTVSLQRHDAIQDVAVVIVGNQVEVVALDDGAIDTEVIGADPDDPNPLARYFRVTERIRHTARAVVYDIEVDSDSDPVDLTTVARVTALPEAVYTYEPAGTTAIERERAMAAEEQIAADLAAEEARATAAEQALAADIAAIDAPDLSEFVKTDDPNVFTETQTVKLPVPQTVGDEDPPNAMTIFAQAKNEDDNILAAMFAVALDLGGGAIYRQGGVFSAEWNPVTQSFTGRRGLLSYGMVSLTEDFQPIYRFAVRVAPDDKVSSLLSAAIGVLQSGDPVLDVDVVNKLWAETNLAAAGDLGALDTRVGDLETDLSAVEGDVATLETDLGTLDGRVVAVEDQLPDTLWQPVVPTDSGSGSTVMMSALLAGSQTWEVDPSVSLHQLYVDASDDISPLGGFLPLVVANPGPGKWARFSLNIVNNNAAGFNLTLPGATTGAPTGGSSANTITVVAVEVFGGDPDPVVLQAYRLATRPV